jgi:hypothetical protein
MKGFIEAVNCLMVTVNCGFIGVKNARLRGQKRKREKRVIEISSSATHSFLSFSLLTSSPKIFLNNKEN